MHEIMHKRREVTVVQINETDANTWSCNRQMLSPDSPVCAYVNIKVTQDSNTTEEKAHMIAQTTAALHSTIGELQEACYVVIDEIPADAWGYNGLTQAARSKQKLDAQYDG